MPGRVPRVAGDLYLQPVLMLLVLPTLDAVRPSEPISPRHRSSGVDGLGIRSSSHVQDRGGEGGVVFGEGLDHQPQRGHG